MQKQQNATNQQWRLLPYGVVFAGSFLAYAILVPQLDGSYANQQRLVFFAALSVIYWGRFCIARFRKEEDWGYVFYYAIITLAAPLEMLFEAVVIK